MVNPSQRPSHTKSSGMSTSFKWGLFFLSVLFVGWTLFLIGGTLIPFAVSFLVAWALSPFVRSLEKRGVSRAIGSIFLVSLFLLFLVTLFLIAAPFLIEEMQDLVFRLPGFARQLIDETTQALLPYAKHLDHHDVKETITQSVGGILQWGLKVLIQLLTSGVALANLITFMIIISIVSYYVLKGWPHMVKHLKSLLPLPYQKNVSELFGEINESLGAFVRGQSLLSLLLVLLYFIGLSLIGLKHALAISVFIGFLSFVPYVGVLIGFVASLSVGVNHFTHWESLWWIVLVFSVIQAAESSYLSPRLVGSQVGLSPAWSLFALFSLGSLLGFVGLLLAYPIAAAIKISVRWSIRSYQKSQTYQKGLL